MGININSSSEPAIVEWMIEASDLPMEKAIREISRLDDIAWEEFMVNWLPEEIKKREEK